MYTSSGLWPPGGRWSNFSEIPKSRVDQILSEPTSNLADAPCNTCFSSFALLVFPIRKPFVVDISLQSTHLHSSLPSFKSFLPQFDHLKVDAIGRLGTQCESRCCNTGGQFEFHGRWGVWCEHQVWMSNPSVLMWSLVLHSVQGCLKECVTKRGRVCNNMWRRDLGGGVTICKSRSKRVITFLCCRITLLNYSVPCWIYFQASIHLCRCRYIYWFRIHPSSSANHSTSAREGTIN